MTKMMTVSYFWTCREAGESNSEITATNDNVEEAVANTENIQSSSLTWTIIISRMAASTASRLWSFSTEALRLGVYIYCSRTNLIDWMFKELCNFYFTAHNETCQKQDRRPRNHRLCFYLVTDRTACLLTSLLMRDSILLSSSSAIFSLILR